MALKIDEIMELSLDDYIAMSKNCNGAVSKDDHEKTMYNGSSKDAKFGRRKGNIDDEEEDDEDFQIKTAKEEVEDANIDEVSTGIWKGPDSSISYLDCLDKKKDLRQKLNKSCKQSFPNVSVQYRMMAPNNVPNRPRGIPTLLPMDAPVNNREWNHNKGHKRNGRNRGHNFNRGFNNGGNVYNNARFSSGGVSNGRVQRNRNQESKNLRFYIGGNNINKNSMNDLQTRGRNMLIETPSSGISLMPSPPLNASFQMPHDASNERRNNNNNGSQFLPVGNLTPQAEAVLNLNSIGGQNNPLTTSNNKESLKSLLGFQGNVSGEMMPIFASRLMEYIQNGLQNPVVHKPVYDMKIQKDIHEIQKKPLLYKCPGGEVVSSDGAGVNCKIIPRTSGVSLNCRFA